VRGFLIADSKDLIQKAGVVWGVFLNFRLLFEFVGAASAANSDVRAA
jgi:hypothetical protein